MSNVCSTAPIRSSIKPYIDNDEDIEWEHVQLFVSNDNSVYRTLEEDEKTALFEHISESLNMNELHSRFPALDKRLLSEDENNEIDHESFSDADYVDDDDYPRVDYDDTVGYEGASNDGFADFVDKDISDDITDFTPHRRDISHSRDWDTDPIDPDDYPDVEDPHDVEGIQPLDSSRIVELEAAKSVHKPLLRRDISLERLENVFKGGPEQAFGEIREFSLGQLQDVFDAVGDENLFLSGLKMYLDPESYEVLYTAYEHSYDQVDIVKDEWELLLEDTHLECEEEYGSVLYNSVFSSETGTPNQSAMGMLGCAIGYYSKLARVLGSLFIKGRSSCKSRCDFGTYMMKCFDTYKGADDFLEDLSDWEFVRRTVDAVCATANQALNTEPSLQSSLGYEEQIADDILYYHHLEPVAASMNFKEELAELEGEYLWRTTSSDKSDPQSVSAAIVIDKCEMEQSDLNDYLQFTLDSCDIRDLFYCKNHYKHTKCLPDLTNTTNPCNNACCLEIKMADCAKTHCASKKAVNEFRVIANVVCSKYADATYMNGELPFPNAGTTVSTSSMAPTSTADSDQELQTPCTDNDGENLDKRYLEEPDEVSIGVQSGGDNSDDVKARVGESVCKIDEFSPGYDTSTCDKREVKDCIKEGIQNIKDDPEHFCPYCVNNNAYDECRCACCFGRYFSKVCYDPNCKDLTEKLRYKRYVKDVCKTKPVTKFLFARDYTGSELGLVEDKPRFKVQRAGKKSPQPTSDNDIDIFAGFDDIQPDVDTKSLDLPTNPNTDLLDTMRKSSLRRPTKGTKLQKRGPTAATVKASRGSPASDEVDSLTNFVEKAHQKSRTSPTNFAKGSLFRGSKPKKGRFSIHDRKKKTNGERESTEMSQEYNGVAKRKKHRRVVGKTSRPKKGGRRSSLSGEKFGKGPKKQPKIRVLNSNAEPVTSQRRHRTPIAKRGFHPRQFLSESELLSGEPVIPSGQKNSLLRKREEQTAYSKGPEIQENPLMLMNVLNTPQSREILKQLYEGNSGQGVMVSAGTRYKTLTMTVTRTATGDVTSVLTSKMTSTTTMSPSLPTTTTIPIPTSIATPSNSMSSYAPMTTTVQLTTTVTSLLTVTLTSFDSESQVPVTSTVTSIETRYRKSTATETEYQSVSTMTTTEWDEVTTETSYKKTVFRYKDTFYETSTIPTTVVMITTKEKLVPNITVTEIEESDHTVNITLTLLDTTTETDYETAYREVSVSTLTTYSSTLTTSVYKYTKTKFKKWGEITTTTTTTETDDVILTRWYPETTLTEYDEIVTKIKYKWYPITYTDYDTEWDTDTITDHETTTTTTTTTLLAAGRPVPPAPVPNLGNILSSFLGRRDYSEEPYKETDKPSKRETTERFGDIDYDGTVEYVIIEEIVEVIYPDEAGIMELSLPQAMEYDDEVMLNDDSAASNSANSTVRSNGANDSYKTNWSLFYRNRSHEQGQESEESGTNKISLDSNIVYASSLLLLLAGAAFILVPDGDDHEVLVQGIEDQGAGVTLDNDEEE